MFRRNIKFLFFIVGLLFALTAQAQTVEEVFHHPGDPVAGNPSSDVTVVEFFDYQCSHCQNMAPTIEAIRKANPNVRFVFKDFPIRGPLSEYAARAALAANMQGKYYQFSHALLTANDLSQSSVIKIAEKMGLNIKKLKKDMYSSTVSNQLRATNELANKLKLRGTPAFIFGRTKDGSKLNYVLGEMTQREMQDAINNTKR